ncbi:MFS transporter [Megasphaera cerevisiae DSM 20462]|jgi:MHS family metabolite:H+ symporter-like MFS transporter|uniref:MFS transporter n=1 Tax=Megasphaera cerevisiae DSM 20462 TaxID=1122219 RepID=A0A0J6X0S2_9FIRM|nr:MFS transporter [Megasphaera cerevisiae]KMO87752.1 MFS transporter [Megasphaera cerevisiae DSM 20462]OKY52566.1 MFS transporter [Megasphaera cerevisiae]SJZ63580.1 MFS transporter, MHS family, metabolite:H+ symporter [Megasphaera cerevisiae DSM 20462]
MSQGNSYQIETKELVKVAASGWLGTAMEFMDFQLYSLAAAIVFSEIFFPESSPAMGLIMAMGTYGAGYVARLIGAFIFGHIGDKLGRRTVLFVTITLMGLASTLIGFLPTYQEVGILAPIGLVVLRIIQGLGAGAEISGAGVMVTEFCEKKNRGLIGSLVCLGTSSGTLVANLIWTIILMNLDKQAVLDWGWRIPFYASFVVMIAAVLIRMFVKESPVMAAKKKLLEEERQKQLAGEISDRPNKTGKKSFLIALALRFGQAGNSGLMQTYFAGFIVTVLAMQKTVATEANIISSIVSFFTIPIVGYLGDRIGRRKMYMILSLATAIYAIPMMFLFETKNPIVLTIAMVIGLNIGVQGLFALENVTMAELFGARRRVTLVSLAKEIAGLVATGFGPIIAAALVAATVGSWWPLAIMIIVFSLASFFGAYFSEDTTGRDLNALDDAM